jgi:hypothetical protein
VYENLRGIEVDSAMSYSDTFSTGVNERSVRMRVRWTAGRDSTGCLRVPSIRVERLEGEPRMTVGNVRYQVLECGTGWDPPGEARYETLLISVERRFEEGMRKRSESGYVGRITGDGRLARP